MTDAIDLTTEQRNILSEILRRFLPGVAVWAYGSRVKWTARPNSDLDLVAFASPAQRQQVSDLKDALAESNLPFPVDLHVWDDVPERFREIIGKEYVVVQKAKPSESKVSRLSEWREVSVDEIKATSENALATGPFGSSIGSRFFTASGIPVIRGSNLSVHIGTRLNDEGLVFLTPDKAQEFSRSTVREGDLVFTCWGTVNQIGLIDRRATYREYVISNKQMKLTPDPAKADSLFLYYLFSSPDLQDRIKNEAIGSSVPGFNLGQLRAMRLVIPEPDEQRAIAHILGTLDDKIELNRRMNETLEAMARALFKSWFVDFDPVRAKADGRDTGLPKPIADLFPDCFEDSELGEIPRGWEIKSAGDLAEVTSGKRPDERFEEGSDHAPVPLWGGNGPMAYVTKPLYNQPILLTGRVGTLGSVFRINTPCWPSDNTLVLLPRAKHMLEFLLLHLRSIDFSVFNRGSTQPLLTQTDLKNRPFATPREEILHEFHKLAGNVFSRIDAHQKESNILAGLRDALLPKLISGELRMKNAEGHIQDMSWPAGNQ